MMLRSEDSRHEMIKSGEQFSIMVIKKRKRPNFRSQNRLNYNQQSRYGNQKNKKLHYQNGFNPIRQRNPNRQYQPDRSSNCQQTQYHLDVRPENPDSL